jgi:hypothetical protein
MVAAETIRRSRMDHSDQYLPSPDEFEAWLDTIPDFIDGFLSMMPTSLRMRLDFSPESLDVIEDWVLERYPDTDAMFPTSESDRINLIACYVGETYRKALEARWEQQSDPKYVYFGLPVLVGKNWTECPHCCVTASADRRTGRYLRSVLNGLTEISRM